MEVTIHVRISGIPDSYFEDNTYDNFLEYIEESLYDIAQNIEGCITNIEIK